MPAKPQWCKAHATTTPPTPPQTLTSSPPTQVDHPLALMPADLLLDSSGAFVIRLAAAARAALWTFPSIPSAAPAVLQLEKCANEYDFARVCACMHPLDICVVCVCACLCVFASDSALPGPPVYGRRLQTISDSSARDHVHTHAHAKIHIHVHIQSHSCSLHPIVIKETSFLPTFGCLSELLHTFKCTQVSAYRHAVAALTDRSRRLGPTAG